MITQKRQILVLGILAVFISAGLLFPGLIFSGDLDPTDLPGSTMHTLEDIYDIVSDKEPIVVQIKMTNAKFICQGWNDPPDNTDCISLKCDELVYEVPEGKTLLIETVSVRTRIFRLDELYNCMLYMDPTDTPGASGDIMLLAMPLRSSSAVGYSMTVEYSGTISGNPLVSTTNDIRLKININEEPTKDFDTNEEAEVVLTGYLLDQ